MDYRWSMLGDDGDGPSIGVTTEPGCKLMVELALPSVCRTTDGKPYFGFAEITADDAEALGQAFIRAAAIRRGSPL